MDIEFKNLNIENTVFIDTRSPGEFEKGHIPNAVNIPLLDNEQRAIVGTIYKQKGQKEAIKKGLELADFKKIYTKLLEISENTNKELVIYCARGGMRSGSVHAFMSSLKINSKRLTGGYKTFRNIVLDTIERKIPNIRFIILNGYTGSGKTEIIKKLKQKNYPVIDLENIAKHMGSAFGSIPYNGIRKTQQQFENELAVEIIKLKNQKALILEGESQRIGWVTLSNNFYEKMKNSDMVLIKRSENYRINRILQDYDLNKKEFEESLFRIKKKLGGEKHKYILGLLKNKEHEKVVKELLNSYYDKLYNYSINKNKNIIKEIESDSDDYIINELIKLYQE